MIEDAHDRLRGLVLSPKSIREDCCFDPDKTFICNAEKGHKGPHTAYGGPPVAVWNNSQWVRL